MAALARMVRMRRRRGLVAREISRSMDFRKGTGIWVAATGGESVVAMAGRMWAKAKKFKRRA